MFENLEKKLESMRDESEMKNSAQEIQEAEEWWQRLMEFLNIEIAPAEQDVPFIRLKTNNELRQILNTAYSKLAQIRAGMISPPVPVEVIEIFVQQIREHLDSSEKILGRNDPEGDET